MKDLEKDLKSLNCRNESLERELKSKNEQVQLLERETSRLKCSYEEAVKTVSHRLLEPKNRTTLIPIITFIIAS